MRVRYQVLSLVLALAVLILGSLVPMWAQSTNTGTVVGTITDQSGRLLARWVGGSRNSGLMVMERGPRFFHLSSRHRLVDFFFFDKIAGIVPTTKSPKSRKIFPLRYPSIVLPRERRIGIRGAGQ